MPFVLSADSFLACLRHSGLINEESMDSLLADLQREGIDVRDPRKIADALVRKRILTGWQAENLLLGRRRGYVFGKYRLLSLLGRGGANAVYLAEHSLMRRRCALKILPAKYVAGSRLARFYEEARAAALLQHTNIVRAYDIGKEMDGKTEIHFIVMEYVEGEGLQDRVARDGPLPVIEAANYIRQVANGLAHAHAAGIVHRDIKPANLLVNREGVVKILDLGLAKLFDDRSLPQASPQILGTADFLSPEQALDSESVDARCDIYSLGCTFYFLLTGQPPFNEGTFTQRLISHQFERPVAIAQKRADVPADLASIVDRMMAKKVSERIQSAEQVAEQLRLWLVQHADRSWLQKNPGLLGAGSVQESAPLAGEPLPPPRPVATSASNAAAAERAVLELYALNTSLLPLTHSLFERRRARRRMWSSGRWTGIRDYWNDRHGRQLMIAAVLFIAVCVVAAWNWLMPPSGPAQRASVPISQPSAPTDR
jgi:eukaryotic-like serine/threonine-protein kinase